MPTATSDEEKVSSISSIRHAGQQDVHFTCLGAVCWGWYGMRGSPREKKIKKKTRGTRRQKGTWFCPIFLIIVLIMVINHYYHYQSFSFSASSSFTIYFSLKKALKRWAFAGSVIWPKVESFDGGQLGRWGRAFWRLCQRQHASGPLVWDSNTETVQISKVRCVFF